MFICVVNDFFSEAKIVESKASLISYLSEVINGQNPLEDVKIQVFKATKF